MKKYFPLLLLLPMMAWAQPSANYYTSDALDGKNGRSLELALKEIVYTHTALNYGELWEAYKTTDPGPADSIPSTYTGGKTDLVYDMYAWMAQFPKYYSDADVDAEAAHSQTGGINREHCVPNSWWGGESGNAIAYTDLHHLVPSDGAANNAKSNWALGEYKTGMTLSWPTSTTSYMTADTHSHTEGTPCKANASHVWKVSNSSQYGGSSSLFEPADVYKGDFARMYLYVVCAYEGLLTWQTNYMFTNVTENGKSYTSINSWALALLLKWHRQDPVSDKERNRNNAVEGIQGNRNPFIDYPELVEYIWGDKSTQNFSLANAVSAYSDAYKNAGSTPTPTEKQPSSITFVLHATVGQPFKGFTYSSNSDGAAMYSSSDTSVATVDAQTGAVTIVAAGETTITYSITATDTYEAASDKYIIQVTQ